MRDSCHFLLFLFHTRSLIMLVAMEIRDANFKNERILEINLLKVKV